MIMKNCK